VLKAENGGEMKRLAALLAAAVAAIVHAQAPSADNRDLPLGTEPWGPEVFRERRGRLMSQMKAGIGLVLAADRIDRDAEARQDENFLYLTGLADEAGAVLMLSPQDTKKEILYLQQMIAERDRWTGYRAMLPNRAIEARVGFDVIRRIDPVGSGALGATLSYRAHRWHDLHFFGPLVGYSSELPKVLDIYSKTSARVPGSHVVDSTALIAKMRMVKEPREIEKIAKATDVAVVGHLEAIRRVRPGMREWELKQIVEDMFRKNGARRLAYPSIVGAGPDGCVLHYPKDDRVIQDGELVLIDAGAEIDHYASDVTRTFPANGKFTPEQRRIYEAVLRAQQAAMDRIRPGATWDELSDVAAKVLADAGYYDYYIHSLGHPVGLNVHDVNLPDQPLADGMVITMEPGVYIPSKRIGIRIEDMILVTKNGYRNLSEKLPRNPDAIEKLMAEARR
jgi:Xaa-Pro aminopeptidase